jgi:hypothetical protein
LQHIVAFTHGVRCIGCGCPSECGQLVLVFRDVCCMCARACASNCCLLAMQGERACIHNETMTAISSHLDPLPCGCAHGRVVALVFQMCNATCLRVCWAVAQFILLTGAASRCGLLGAASGRAALLAALLVARHSRRAFVFHGGAFVSPASHSLPQPASMSRERCRELHERAKTVWDMLFLHGALTAVEAWRDKERSRIKTHSAGNVDHASCPSLGDNCCCFAGRFC